MSAKHLVRFSELLPKAQLGSFISLNLDEEIHKHFKDVNISSYKIESTDQSSVFTAEGSVVVTSLIISIEEDGPSDYEGLND